MYYSVVDFMVKDFVNGLVVIEKWEVEFIGDLEICYCEDLVCMLCVVCFVVKFGMCIEVKIVVLIKFLVNFL